MTSLEFFSHQENPSLPRNWGNGEPRHVKIDATLDYSPNYIQKDQRDKQYYQLTQLKYSNVRAHDQIEPKSLELDMNEYQLSEPFPMKHPYASHIVEKVLFPSYTAPEDPKQGEEILRSTTKIISKETKSQADNTIVQQKISGFPYRTEIKSLKLPSQKLGLWQVDRQLYQNVKPDRDTHFYPIPTSILAPNPRKYAFTASLDSQAWNILRNKERELMQTQNQIDFYKDGLGTRAPLNSDNYHEKQLSQEKTGKVSDEMRPYFKRGGGLHRGSLNFELQHSAPSKTSDTPQSEIQYGPYTQVEIDEYRMEAGREYKSYPEVKFSHNLKAPALKPRENLAKASATSTERKSKTSKLITEKAAREKYFHDKNQRVELLNRFTNLNLIKPESNLKVLRQNHRELEKNGKVALKQNVNDHVNTFYNQEAKYLSERTELYKTPSYNPYELKQLIEMSKNNRDSLSVSGLSKKENVFIKDDTYEHRPKLFADKVFNDFEMKKRGVLEDKLLNPKKYTSSQLQEDGLILKQSNYGDNYNTKKYLQENELISQRLTEPVYGQIDEAHLNYQDIALKSKVDKVALDDYTSGLATQSNDLHRAREIVQLVDTQTKQRELETVPRYAGPLGQPYEDIYNTQKIVEHSDGATKRFYERVYESPFVSTQQPEYQMLRSDLKLIQEEDAKRVKQVQESNKRLEEELRETLNKASRDGYSIKDKMENQKARDAHNGLRDPLTQSIYASDYNFDGYTQNDNDFKAKSFYDSIEYKEQPFLYEKPNKSRLVTLQDKWSKTESQKRFLSAYPQPTVDLRDNYKVGKGPVFISPIQAAKNYSKSMVNLVN